MNKINKLIENWENGNITIVKEEVKKLNKQELLNLILEMALLNGDYEKSVTEVNKMVEEDE